MTKELWLTLLSLLAIWNLVTFCLYAADKSRARRGRRRIRERTLLLAAFFGGSPGALFAMYSLRHKTLHKKFTLGIPAMLILQAGFAIFLLSRHFFS